MIHYVLYEQFVQEKKQKSCDSVCIICPFVLFSIRLPSMVQFQHKGSVQQKPCRLGYFFPTDVNASLLTGLPLNKLLD